MKTSKFTLIELLVVIGIIGILIGILLPAIASSIKEGKKTKAESDCRQIAFAIEAYALDYQILPTSGSSDQTYDFEELRPILYGGNARSKIYFDSKFEYLNPWDNIYQVRLDLDYDNTVTTPHGSYGGKVVVWTLGPQSEILSSKED